MQGLLNYTILFMIFIFSFWIGRISPNEFRRDFPLALLLFSQVYLAIKLALAYEYWLVIAFGIAFLNAFIAVNGVFNLRNSEEEENGNQRERLVLILSYITIFILILIISAGIGEFTDSILVAVLFGYSFGLIPLWGLTSNLRSTPKLLLVSVCIYYALVGFCVGYCTGLSSLSSFLFSIVYVASIGLLIG